MSESDGELIEYERPGLMSRLLSTLIVVLYLRLAHAYGGWGDVLGIFACLVVPVACIWYPDVMGLAVAMIRPAIFRTDLIPGSVVLFFGWAALILPGAVLVGVWAAGLVARP